MQDLKYGLRSLLRSPGFAVAAILTLALGIGANTALFSVVHSVLLKPLPYQNPDPLVMVWEWNLNRGRDRNVVAPANYLDWQARNIIFADLAAFVPGRTTLTGNGEPEQLRSESTTASYFTVLGAQALQGRVYTTEEDKPGAARVAIVSHALWMRRFGGDAAIVGKSLTMDGTPVTVIGIMPADFRPLSNNVDIWQPLGLNPATNYRVRAGRYLMAVARLKAGVSVDRAQAELRQIASSLQQEYPDFNKAWSTNIVPLQEQVTSAVKLPLLILMGAVGFVLLIACSNVANLLLARGSGRRRELAVRSSLGATRGRIIRQLLSEAVLLAFAGAACGCLMAFWSISALRNLSSDLLPRASEVSLSFTTLAFTSLLAIVSGLLFGAAPALGLSRLNLVEGLQEGGRSGIGGRHNRLRNLLVVAEIALSVVLLVGAGLLIQSFRKLTSVNPGFDAQNVLTLQVSLPGSRYREAIQRVTFFQEAVQKFGQLPGVQSAGYIMFLPFTGPASATSFHRADRPLPEPGQYPGTEVRIAHPDYFRTMRIPLLKGRTFEPRDLRIDAPMQFIVNDAMVRAMYPNEDPLGKRLSVSMGDPTPGEIIGVVGDTKHASLEENSRPMVYYPHSKLAFPFTSFVIRSELPESQLTPVLLRALREMDPSLPAYNVHPMEFWLAESVARQRLQTMLLGLLAALALVLSIIGIYGVMAYVVSLRTQEIGVRMALGASRLDVLQMVLSRGMTLVAVGLGCGVCAALLLTRLLRSLLYQVQPSDPMVYVTVASVLATAALLACLVPARSASRLDPLKALRHD